MSTKRVLPERRAAATSLPATAQPEEDELRAAATGDWNPTLPVLVIGIWGLTVGIAALRVRFERPPTAAEVDRAVERLTPGAAGTIAPAGLRRLARRRLQGVDRLRFHLAAWVLGMIVIAPLNLLIEWQDNGGFERWSNDSQPGSWDPWALYVGGIWALAVAVIGLWEYVALRAERARIARDSARRGWAA
jgi:hypothetical protein